jgi:hypothetical protein
MAKRVPDPEKYTTAVRTGAGPLRDTELMSSHTNCGEVLKQGDRLGPVPECPDRARHAFALRLKADRENPAWTKETFARARKARDVLPEIFGAASAAKIQGAYIDLNPIATGNIGALEGHGPGLANTDGRSIVESCLIDM